MPTKENAMDQTQIDAIVAVLLFGNIVFSIISRRWLLMWMAIPNASLALVLANAGYSIMATVVMMSIVANWYIVYRDWNE